MFGFGKRIAVDQINSEVADGKAMLIDVRGDDEWDAGHAKGAAHLSVERIMSGDVPTKDKERKLYLYCASGGRASMAQQMLQGKGYEVENLGGLRDWRAAGGATEA